LEQPEEKGQVEHPERRFEERLRGGCVEMSSEGRRYTHTSAGEETLYYMITVPERRARRDEQ